ncbi:unnamed protein product [Chrysoparadoxa australica]
MCSGDCKEEETSATTRYPWRYKANLGNNDSLPVGMGLGPMVLCPSRLPHPASALRPHKVTAGGGGAIGGRGGKEKKRNQRKERQMMQGQAPDQEACQRLGSAAQAGDLALVQELLARGVDPNGPGLEERDSPLYRAVWGGERECISCLLGAGASVNGVGIDSTGCGTALHSTCRWGRNDVLQLLLHHGAALNARNNLGDTALMHAVIFHKSECAMSLLKAGADVSLRNHEGLTALHYACAEGLVEVTERLLQLGADPCIVVDACVAGTDDVAGCCQAWWRDEPEAYHDVPRSRRKACIAALGRSSKRAALWKGRSLPIMLLARYQKGEDVIAGAADDAEAAKLRELVLWLLRQTEAEGRPVFRLIVRFLGEDGSFTGAWPCTDDEDTASSQSGHGLGYEASHDSDPSVAECQVACTSGDTQAVGTVQESWSSGHSSRAGKRKYQEDHRDSVRGDQATGKAGAT